MFDLDSHREDFVKLSYDLLKIWITLAIITPALTGKTTLVGAISSFLISLGLFLIAIILRQGGEIN
ncbi:MAG: hypothetical protein ACPL4K_02300 [Candidatus Margulisiibacteriota bacterium]